MTRITLKVLLVFLIVHKKAFHQYCRTQGMPENIEVFLPVGVAALAPEDRLKSKSLGFSVKKTRVLRRSGVIDRSPSLIFLKSKRATPLLIKISEFDIQHSDNIVYICRTYRNKISRKCSLFSLSEPRKFEKCRE